MSRPLPPSFAKSVTNFPAGANPWNGQPLRVAPATDYFTPNTGVAAEEVNYELGTICDFLQGSIDWSGSGPVLNFGAQNTLGTTPRCAAYDPFFGLWVAGGNASGPTAPVMYQNHGTDSADWTAWPNTPGGLGDAVMAICKDPTGAKYYAATWQSGTMRVSYQPNGGSWTSLTTFLATSNQCELVPFKNVIVIAMGDSGANGFIDYIGTPGGTPGLFLSGPTGVTAPWWLVKTSPSLIVAVPSNTNGAGSAPYWTSTDGQTWTARTFSNSTIVKNADRPTGLAYDASRNMWFMSVFETSSSNTRICQSSDAVTWTAVRELQGGSGSSQFNPYYIQDLEACGSLLIGVTNDGGTVWPQAANIARFVVSADGGNTWYWSPGYMTGGTASPRTRAICNGSEIVVISNTGLRLSQSAGFASNALL